jgi:hypothetical protein
MDIRFNFHQLRMQVSTKATVLLVRLHPTSFSSQRTMILEDVMQVALLMTLSRSVVNKWSKHLVIRL